MNRTDLHTRVYLDYAATTPARPEAIAAMVPLLGDVAYNPSSLHAEGRAARAALDDARSSVARVLGAKPREIVFTAGGTESIGLGVIGTARACAARGRHAISSAIEHHAVLRALDVLESDGWSITRLPVDADGRVDPEAFRRALRADTTLATFMLANNEIGTLEPIAELAAIARAAGVVFHTDAIQAPFVLRLDVDDLGVDLVSLAGHKFYGPKGVGVLYVRSGTPVAAVTVGGGQEHGLRAGTENVAGIAGLAEALELAQAHCAPNAGRLGALRDRLERGIVATIPDIHVNAAGAPRLASISSIAFAGAPADALLMQFDLAGIAVSAGSACTAGSLEPSHVAIALGLAPRLRGSVIRFSLGHMTTAGEVDQVLAVLPQLVSDVRAIEAVV